MTGEKIFEIIGMIDDDLVFQADQGRAVGLNVAGKWTKWLAVAACGLIVASSGIQYLGSLYQKESDGGQIIGGQLVKATFVNYAGPILPLNATGNTEEIVVERQINMSLVDGELEGEPETILQVQDEYALKNNSDEVQELVAYYPFISNLKDAQASPKVMIDGKEVQTTLIAGDYSGEIADGRTDGKNLQDTADFAHINSYEGYMTLLNGDYFEKTVAQEKTKDGAVTVYTFNQVYAPEKYEKGTVAVDFKLPTGTTVITDGIEDGSIKGDSRQYRFFAGKNAGDKQIVFVGQPPADFTVTGYETEACERVAPEIIAQVQVDTMDFSQMLKESITGHERQWALQTAVPSDQVCRAVMEMLRYTTLGNEPKDRYNWLRLDDLIQEAYALPRVLYAQVPVVLRPGQTVAFSASLLKLPSFDFGGVDSGDKGINGYELLSTLGSNLHFSSEKALLNMAKDYQFVEENFGFASNNIPVALAPHSRYYFDVKTRK